MFPVAALILNLMVLVIVVHNSWSKQWRAAERNRIAAEDERRFQEYAASKEGQVHFDVCWRVEKEPDRLAKSHACVKTDYYESCEEMQKAVDVMEQACASLEKTC